jgi:hypothetical protein
MPRPIPLSRGPGIISQALHALVSQVPASIEAPRANPAERVKALAQTAALKAAALSGTLTLPPGPLGMATVLPDLLAVWRIQQQLVADIAGAYGKTSALTPEIMVICLFRHGGAALTGRLFTRAGSEVVVPRIPHRTLLQLLEKIAVRLTQRLAAKSFWRWLPVLGALGAGAYSYYDTAYVATNAIELFSQDLRIKETAEDSAAKTTRRPSRAKRKPAARTTGKSATSGRKQSPTSTRAGISRRRSGGR